MKSSDDRLVTLYNIAQLIRTSSMICTSCNKDLRQDAIYCTNCAFPVASSITKEMARSTSFVGAISSGFKNFSNFNGRSTRSEYWWWILFSSLASLLLGTFVIPLIILLIPTLTITVRRFHDVGRSGRLAVILWLLFNVVGPTIFVGMIIFAIATDSGPSQSRWVVPQVMFALALSGLGVMMFSFIYWLSITTKSGEIGPNKHGSDPYMDSGK